MKTVHEVLSMTTAGVVKATTELLCKEYKQVFIHGDDFVYAVGTGPICVVAHMDTVRDPQIEVGKTHQRHQHNMGKPFNLVQYRNVLRNADGILGADDRAGVFACLELMRRCKKEKLPMPSIILTNGEESGGKGVGVFVATEIFSKHDKGRTKMFVEMDRQSCNEWVTYGTPLPKEIVEYVESFGFVKGNGSYSDIQDLQEEYLIPSVNLSIGYYQQHSNFERLHIDEMYTTINRVHNMMRDPIAELYPVTKKVKFVSAYYDHRPYNGPHGVNSIDGKKNLPATTTTGTTPTGAIKHVSYIESVGRKDIDECLDKCTQGGFCETCGFDWVECECGVIATLLDAWLNVDDMKFLCKNYLDKEDPIRSQIELLIKEYAEGSKVVDAEATDDTKDPHHVGKDGDRVIIPN